MERIGVRELRQHASRYLDRVRAGETVEVTDRGQLIALLVPPNPAQGARDQLVAQGRLKPAAGRMAMPVRADPREATSAVLDALRSDGP